MGDNFTANLSSGLETCEHKGLAAHLYRQLILTGEGWAPNRV